MTVTGADDRNVGSYSYLSRLKIPETVLFGSGHHGGCHLFPDVRPWPIIEILPLIYNLIRLLNGLGRLFGRHLTS